MASPPLTSFLINSNVELGVLVFIFSSVLRAGSPSLLPSSSYASGRTGEEILWCSTQLRSFLKNLSQSHAHSLALCCSCFPGGLLAPRLARRAPESLGFPFFIYFFGPRRFRAVGRRWWEEKFSGGGRAVIVASPLAAFFAPGSVRRRGKERALVTSSDIGTFSRSRREEKVK